MSTSGTTRVVEVDDGSLSAYDVSPDDVGLSRAHPSDVPAGTPAENAEVTRRILAGEPGPARDLAVFNAGAAILAGGRAETLEAGVRAAEAAVDSGAAAAALTSLVDLSGELAGAGVAR